jgi:hypothetical protein
VAHYLIEVQNAVLYNQDLEKPLATLFAAVDVSQGFNRICHNKCITRLSDMGCPGWLLKIVLSYLTGRELTVRWKGQMSNKKPLYSGTGQGTILGMFLFCVMFNGAGPPESIETVGKTITQTRKKRKAIEKGKKKWVDDMSVLVPVRLSDCLVPDTRHDIVRPVPYHSRTGHLLPRQTNQMQTELDRISDYFKENYMITNQQKSKVMIFNRSTKYDVMPELTISNEQNLEVVEEMKLVGYKLRSDLRTCSNTTYIVTRAYKRMWIIRRLRALGASTQDLLRVLRTQVISVLQFAIPAWTTMLTLREESHIESVLKTGLYLVYGQRYLSYKWALQEAGMISLKDQRFNILKKFTKRCISSNKFSTWFEMNKTVNDKVKTRTCQLSSTYKEVYARTKSFAKSPIPQMVTIANSLTAGNLKSRNIVTNSGQIIIL